MNFSRKSKTDTPTSTTSTPRAGTPRAGSAPTGADVPTASDPVVSRPSAAASSTPPNTRTPEPGATRPARSPEAADDSAAGHLPPRDAIDPDAKDDTTGSNAGLTDKGRVKRTRVSALWIGGVVAAILAIFLLIFIAQNSEKVTIKFLVWDGQIPLAVAMLLAAVVSVLIVAVPGSLRIGQLRRALRKNAKS